MKEQAAARGPPTSQWVSMSTSAVASDPSAAAASAPPKTAPKKKRRPMMAKLVITDNHTQADEQPTQTTEPLTTVAGAASGVSGAESNQV